MFFLFLGNTVLRGRDGQTTWEIYLGLNIGIGVMEFVDIYLVSKVHLFVVLLRLKLRGISLSQIWC